MIIKPISKNTIIPCLNILKYLLFFTILLACIEEKDTDIEQPSAKIISPSPCDTIYFGQSFQFKINLSDNTGLGNISMDLHHNFEHHNHGAHESCNMDDPKKAINPYYNNWIFSLPETSKSFTLDTLLSLPSMKNDSVHYDTGDYHFHFYITDNEGYQTFTTLDMKIKY